MRLHLAPIQDMTTALMRRVFAQEFGGIDVYYAPFISATHMRKFRSKLFTDIQHDQNPDNMELVPQLLGSDPDYFKHFAKIITSMGYDEVNWNIGCPFPAIVKKKKGSGILPYPDLVRQFLDEVCKDKDYDLSVKMRLGLKSSDEGPELIEVLNDYPIKNVIIHGRTGKMFYGGQVDLNAFEVMYKACKHNVIFNGDIFNLDDYHVIKDRFSDLQDVMIGRGALRDPFLPSEIKGAHFTAKEKYTKIMLYHDAFYYGIKDNYDVEQFLCNRMKEFWQYTSHQLPDSEAFLTEIRLSNTIDDYEQVVAEKFKIITS